MRIFILEDDHERIAIFRRKLIGHELVVAETAQQAINILGTHKDGRTRRSLFDLIFLDHDLGGQQFVSASDKNTGSEVVRWMILEMGHCPPIIVHSLNTVEAPVMVWDLSAARFECHRIPFDSLLVRLDDPDFITQ